MRFNFVIKQSLLVIIIGVVFLPSVKSASPINPHNYDEIDTHPFPNDYRSFSDTSPVNMKIPSEASYEPDSDKYMDFLKTNQVGDKFFVTIDGWTYPIYIADADTPRYDIPLTNDWSETLTEIPNMHILDGALPNPKGDGHLVVLDIENNMEYDLWEAKYTLGKWKASWGNYISLASDGVYENGLSARGSGFASSLGVILPNEIIAGEINHALFWSVDDAFVMGFGPIRPASESDGTSEEQYSMPEGTRLQLNSAIDITTLGLSNQDMIIAKALQEYGMILGDNGGGIGFYAANPISQDWDWNNYFPRDADENYLSYIFDGKISTNNFKILTMGYQIENDPILPGQKLPEYHIYLEGEEVIDNCNDLGEPIEQNEDAAGFTLNISIFSFFVLVIYKNKKQLF